MLQIKTVDELRKAIADENTDFCILLNGGLRSSKFINELDEPDKEFYVFSENDGTEDNFSESDLFNSFLSNIGEAMNKGAFYMYE